MRGVGPVFAVEQGVRLCRTVQVRELCRKWVKISDVGHKNIVCAGHIHRKLTGNCPPLKRGNKRCNQRKQLIVQQNNDFGCITHTDRETDTNTGSHAPPQRHPHPGSLGHAGLLLRLRHTRTTPHATLRHTTTPPRGPPHALTARHSHQNARSGHVPHPPRHNPPYGQSGPATAASAPTGHARNTCHPRSQPVTGDETGAVTTYPSHALLGRHRPCQAPKRACYTFAVAVGYTAQPSNTDVYCDVRHFSTVI